MKDDSPPSSLRNSRSVPNPSNRPLSLSASLTPSSIPTSFDKARLDKAKNRLSFSKNQKPCYDPLDSPIDEGFADELPEVLRPQQAKSKMLKAVKAQQYSLVWALLGKGADPNECEDNGSGWAPLHHAAKEGNLAIIQLLVSKGADVNARDKSGQTPLHRAAYWGKLQVVDFLVYVGANTKITDSLNQTPEEISFHRNNLDIYHFLADVRSHSTKKTKTWNVKKQFEQLLKDQAKEEKLLRRNQKMEEKLIKLTKETQRLLMFQDELEKRGKELPKKEQLRLEKVADKKVVLVDEIRKNNIDITMARSENFEKYAKEGKAQTWMSFLEEY